MVSEMDCDSRLIDALESVDSWDNEEPLVLVTGTLDELRAHALVVKEHFAPTAKGLINWMNMCARFEYRFGVPIVP